MSIMQFIVLFSFISFCMIYRLIHCLIELLLNFSDLLTGIVSSFGDNCRHNL
ncbi:hypothetical protein Scep_014171 [Stephania cephalantha]|uniref:Uncharacterized protein n=1 Tax=Stephania cephalantha TaxID=152367 RepID=A0AAP0J226_9MAGN